MSGEKDIVEDVYATASSAGSEQLYDKWAADYDLDNAKRGCRLPGLAAAFLTRHLPYAESGPILDAGCGTGQVGECLQVLGYDDITGLDLSAKMLESARRTGAYSKLLHARLGERLELPSGAFAGVLCVGSFGPGHAPPETVHELCRVARPGAAIVFNVVEQYWKDQGFPQQFEQLNASGTWHQLEESEPFRPYTIGERSLFCRLFAFRRL